MPCVRRKLLFLFVAVFAVTWQARAEAPSDSSPIESENAAPSTGALSEAQRKRLAQSFLSRLKPSIESGEAAVRQLNLESSGNENILPEGEAVLLQPMFPPNLKLDELVSGFVKNGKPLVSLTEFMQTLKLAVAVNEDGQGASGWYIRKDRKFSLDMKSGLVRTAEGEFKISNNVVAQDGDIFAEPREIGKWIGVVAKIDVGTQEMALTSDLPIPLIERYNRRKFELSEAAKKEAELPRKDTSYTMASVPVVDVTTNSTYRKEADDDEPYRHHNAVIRTSNDFAKGNLTTQSLVNNRDQVQSIRATYKQESDKPDLLGRLKARSFEIGDVTTTAIPIGSTMRSEVGVRVTNADKERGTLSPTTTITGVAIPGWDVELFRESQLIGFQEVDDSGRYSFEKVTLFQNDNRFRLVFYGPQGEMTEETVYVPVDPSRIAEGAGVYDVSLTLDEKQTYIKRAFEPEQDGYSPNLFATYETSLGGGRTVNAGFRTNEKEDVRNYVANAGVSATVKETLLNLDAAVDDEGEMLAELTARRSFGQHDIRDTLSWNGEGFDLSSGGGYDESFIENQIDVTGPIPFLGARNARYFADAAYSTTMNGEEQIEASAGVSGGYRAISASQEFQYNSEPAVNADESVRSVTSVTGGFGPHRVRTSVNYDIKPDSELTRVLANYRRYINKNLDFELEWNKNVPQDLSEYSAKLDWQAGFIRISPSVRYNSERDFFAGLTTRFGILQEPHTGDVRMMDKTMTSAGGLSAFVFFDKDGDGKFNGEDEPLPDVIVQALQNGGRVKTDEHGIALFTKMRETKLTDVLLDAETLQDPSWVPGFKGASILPRAGYVASLEFPVHLSGEMDGVIALDGVEHPLKEIGLTLYNAEGKAEQTTTTDVGGFYYFTRIPPGRYLLIVDERSARRGNFIRPEPQQIEIGYDGTVIYGNNIIVKSGKGDVPSEIMADLEDYKARHPQIDFSQSNYDIVLNLGEYNSNVLMSVVWYKLRTRYAPIVGDGRIFVPPSESHVDEVTGKHTLRVGFEGVSIDGAYNRCRALMARSRYCKVEIYPAYMKQAQAQISAAQVAQ